MCMEDVRIGRDSGSTQQIVEMTTTPRPIVEVDQFRTTLIISAPSAGILTLSFLPTVTANNGIRLNTTDPPLILTLQKHGSIVTRMIYGIMSAGTINIGVWTAQLTKT
jgi:hypothetical protein